MNKELPPKTNSDENLDDELSNVVGGEQKSVRREKFDLSSTRVVLDRLLREGLIGLNDKLSDVRSVVEEEYRRLEDI